MLCSCLLYMSFCPCTSMNELCCHELVDFLIGRYLSLTSYFFRWIEHPVLKDSNNRTVTNCCGTYWMAWKQKRLRWLFRANVTFAQIYINLILWLHFFSFKRFIMLKIAQRIYRLDTFNAVYKARMSKLKTLIAYDDVLFLVGRGDL